ncbi:MAG: enolase C-terminal domain-like protein [Nanoarchaeota archaeon]
MIIKSVSAKSILDCRKDKTISVKIETNSGNFEASSPSGKSTGKYEAKSYKKNLEGDIKTLKEFKDYFSKEIIENFDDLRRVEDIVEGHIGANSLFALESAVLKALAKEQKKEVWQLINPKLSSSGKFPRSVGNCIGGGKHSQVSKKPDFQEFLLIPDEKTFKENFEKNKKIKDFMKISLKKTDESFKGEKNDENAWITSLNEKEVFDILKEAGIPLGTDVASSGFYKRKKYLYQNPMLKRTEEEQFLYIENLIKNFELFYAEDPFDEEDFDSFAKLLAKFKNCLIVGDDLIVTNHKRLERAIKKRSVNAIIVKPNQCGSLLEVRRVVEMAKKNNIKTVFSHRSGETEEWILADLAFGFQADFFKCGIDGAERETKLRRLIEIEKALSQ